MKLAAINQGLLIHEIAISNPFREIFYSNCFTWIVLEII